MRAALRGISIRSRRDAGTHIEHAFGFIRGQEAEAVTSLLEAMVGGEEISVVDPSDPECSRDVRRVEERLELKRGCHGSYGTWKLASLSEAREWLLSAALHTAATLQPGFGATYKSHDG